MGKINASKGGAAVWAVVAVIVIAAIAFIASRGPEDEPSRENGQAAGGTVEEGSGQNPGPAGTMPEGSGASVGAGAAADVGVDMLATREFKVNGGSMYFDPKEIRVNRGERVRIVFTNVEGFHDWVIDEFSAKTGRLQAGQTQTIEFVADKAGTFEYYCSVGNHRQQGMKGNLIVE